MAFEWDEDKNQSNLHKHGVSFETARQIFSRPILTSVDDRKDYGEVRNISIGQTDVTTVIVVVHAEREGNIRLISARPASRKERWTYRAKVRQGA